MSYTDGFVLPVPADKLDVYKKIARLACKVWLEHGALEYWETVLEDAQPDCGLPFAKLSKAKPGETVVFAWIRYKSRKHRDQVNAKAMKDPRLAKFVPESMPFDVKRMAYGGFKPLVGARADE
jgi:uncharacterized protein YbaA (DUF1428 family)